MNRPACALLALTLSAAPLLVGACGHSAVHYDYAKEPDPRKLEYVIGVADGLTITVWHNPDLSAECVVRPDGTITMPLIGDVKASGRTPSELKAEITSRLATFVKDQSAVVTVAVTGVNSYRFTVSGNVEGPGVFTAPNYVTVVEALALAGGLNKFASRGALVLIRHDARTGKVRRVPIDYDDIRSSRRPEANLVLMPGDTLFVP
jgi:polysaccharide export outer membrane protein